LHKITGSGVQYKMRVEMESWKNESQWVEYGIFNVADEASGYQLVIGLYNRASTAPDQMIGSMKNNGQKFSTVDIDNDKLAHKSCSEDYSAGGKNVLFK